MDFCFPPIEAGSLWRTPVYMPGVVELTGVGTWQGVATLPLTNAVIIDVPYQVWTVYTRAVVTRGSFERTPTTRKVGRRTQASRMLQAAIARPDVRHRYDSVTAEWVLGYEASGEDYERGKHALATAVHALNKFTSSICAGVEPIRGSDRNEECYAFGWSPIQDDWLVIVRTMAVQLGTRSHSLPPV